MFNIDMNREESSLQRGMVGFLRNSASKLRRDPQQEYPFRPLHRPVFQVEPPAEEPTQVYPSYDQVPHHDVAPVAESVKFEAPVVEAPIDDIPFATRLIAMDWQRRQQRLVAHVNSSQPVGCHVIAYNILPLELFAGDIGRFLMMACDFYGHGFSNTMLLPAMAAGAAHFDLPQHPLVISDIQKTDARTRVSQLRTRVANTHHRVALAIESGDMSALFNQNNNRFDYKQALAGICKSVAINTFGLSAYMKHEKRFYEDLR